MNRMIRNFKSLDIWRRSRQLVKEVYLATEQFPSDEKFGLISQIKRSAVSVPSNIAEGCGQKTEKQLKYYLNIAIGSSCELETQLYLSFDLSFISEHEMAELTREITEIRKMIIGYQKTLKG